MGISMSNAEVVGENMTSVNETKGVAVEDDREVKESMPKFDESRLVELLQALQRISRLQEEAANAQIDARQKMRGVGLKRQKVWSSDAAFMRELQGLMARGRLEGFQDLVRLSAVCQTARDGLGPLEQEGIEAEQQWEGSIWNLRQAEQRFYQEFEYEFQSARLYSPPTSAASSQYESSSELGSTDNGDNTAQGIFQHRNAGHSVVSSSSFTVGPFTSELLPPKDTEISQDTTLLGIDGTPGPKDDRELNTHTWDSDSGIGDIDRIPDPAEDLLGPAQSLPTRPHASVELYPHLLTDFSSRRDRINKWLQHTTLVSRFEASLLRDQLALESVKTPSNWSQLVIAYWELDGAASPKLQQRQHSDSTSQPNSIPPPQSVAVKNTPHNDSIIQSSKLAKPKFWSPASSNPDHGYFSDFRSGSRESLRSFLVPLRPAPRRSQAQSKPDADKNSTKEVPKDHKPP